MLYWSKWYANFKAPHQHSRLSEVAPNSMPPSCSFLCMLPRHPTTITHPPCGMWSWNFWLVVVVVVVVVIDKILIFLMTSSPHPFRTDRQKFQMAANIDENSKWSSGVMKFKMAANDDKIPGHMFGQRSKVICRKSSACILLLSILSLPSLLSFFKIARSTPDGGDDYNSNSDRKIIKTVTYILESYSRCSTRRIKMRRS